MIKKAALGLTLVALLAFVGCGKAPDAEMTAAQTASQTAMSAEAEQYAPASYRMAMDTLNAAMAAKTEQDSKFALFRSYGSSKDMFVRAEALSKQAEADAATAKEAMKQEVMTMITNAQAALDSANAVVAKAPVGKGNRAEIELIKTDLVSVAATFQEAQNDFNAGSYMTAKTKLEAVMENANRVASEVANAAAMKSGKM
ncbi:MAG: DUF4398 domain-containing protein [candidate division Zixibacteria bacterium]|nr:DUF4398 domain-containing protein [candidate division Zixibacteria bacterium]